MLTSRLGLGEVRQRRRRMCTLCASVPGGGQRVDEQWRREASEASRCGRRSPDSQRDGIRVGGCREKWQEGRSAAALGRERGREFNAPMACQQDTMSAEREREGGKGREKWKNVRTNAGMGYHIWRETVNKRCVSNDVWRESRKMLGRLGSEACDCAGTSGLLLSSRLRVFERDSDRVFGWPTSICQSC